MCGTHEVVELHIIVSLDMYLFLFVYLQVPYWDMFFLGFNVGGTLFLLVAAYVLYTVSTIAHIYRVGPVAKLCPGV